MQSFLIAPGSKGPDINPERKELVDAMLRMRTPQNVGEGLHSVAKAIIARRQMNREQQGREQFNEQFGKIAPNVQGMVDLANSPYASSGHKKILEALMRGAPNFKRGGRMPFDGEAVVGENGPEVVRLPKGAQVLTPEQQQMLQQYDPASQQRLLENPQDLQPDPIDPREMIGPQSSFTGGDFQVAELDAHKFLAQQPEYEAVADGKVNASNAKNIAYLRRAMFADAAMQDPKLLEAMTRMDNSIAGSFGALGRLYTDKDYEVGRLMAEQFASAILRRDSGAATPDQEVARYTRQYFPLPNETEGELAAKKSLRREEIRGLQQALGGEDTSGIVSQIEAEIADLVARSQREKPQQISAEDQEFLKSLGLE